MPVVIGLMSGTSMDGVDAAACDISLKRNRPLVTLLAAASGVYPRSLRNRLLSLSESAGATVEDLCELDVAVGRAFAGAALKVMRAPGVKGRRAGCIGSHGQTVAHAPKRSASLQIGDGSVIAARTGVRTWFDFRAADLAAGGQGAPLAPVAHLPLFGDTRKSVTVINIGGIANLTHIPAGAKDLAGLIAYDNGPGNMLIDLAAQRMGAGPFDRNGRIAARGKVNEPLLRRMLAHPYFRRRPPKSTGRETFGAAFVSWAGLARKKTWNEHTVATMTELTARSVARELHRLRRTGRPADRMVICGGGALNRFLVGRIRDLAETATEVVVSDDLGVPCKMVEPILMALLAFYAENGVALNLSTITGSNRPMRLGVCAPAIR